MNYTKIPYRTKYLRNKTIPVRAPCKYIRIHRKTFATASKLPNTYPCITFMKKHHGLRNNSENHTIYKPCKKPY